RASVASNRLSLTTAPVPPAMNTQSPNCVQITVVFVNRTSCAKAVSPSLKANSGASDAQLASSTRPSTVTPRAVNVTRSSTLMSVATSPEPGVTQVRVTPSAFGRRNCLRTKQRLGGGGRVRIEGQGLFNCAPQLCRCKRFSQRPRGSQELGIPPQIDPTGRIPAGYGDYPDAGEFLSNPTQRDDA